MGITKKKYEASLAVVSADSVANTEYFLSWIWPNVWDTNRIPRIPAESRYLGK